MVKIYLICILYCITYLLIGRTVNRFRFIYSLYSISQNDIKCHLFFFSRFFSFSFCLELVLLQLIMSDTNKKEDIDRGEKVESAPIDSSSSSPSHTKDVEKVQVDDHLQHQNDGNMPALQQLTVEELYDKDKYDLSTMEPGNVFVLLQ